jgi:hypothetical protein
VDAGLTPIRSLSPLPTPRLTRGSNPLVEVTIIGKKPGQSVEKRRREREKFFKKQDKEARKAARLEENARRKETGEDFPLPAAPEDEDPPDRPKA